MMGSFEVQLGDSGTTICKFFARPEGKPVSEVFEAWDGRKGILFDGEVALTSSDLLFGGQTYQFRPFLQAPSLLPSRVRKQDPTRKMIEDCSAIECFPEVRGLNSFLQRNPLQSGFPISSEYFERLRHCDSHGLFREEDQDHLCKKLDSLLRKVLDPPSTGSTVVSFHQFWDELINDFVQLFCCKTMYRDRNKNCDESSGKFRPDVIGVLEAKWALWRAEEKAPNTPGEPMRELLHKLTWVYGTIPYVLAYFTRGTRVTFAALYMQHGTKRGQTLLSFDLSNLDHRVDTVLACLNVGRLLLRLSALCEDYQVGAEFEDLRVKNGKQVKLYGGSVKKSYETKAAFESVVAIYEHISGCPNAERKMAVFPKDEAQTLWHSIVFEPRVQFEMPRPESKLVKALVCIAKALCWLHAKSFMHRDVRWSNIGNFRDEWFLLDFDDGCFSPQLQAHERFNPENHAPETCSGEHSCAVDIWGLGYLIKTSEILGLSRELIELQDWCLTGLPHLRPSAEDCLEKLSLMIHDGLE